MNTKLSCPLLLLIALACVGCWHNVIETVQIDGFLENVQGTYRATFRTAAKEQKTVFVTLRDRREHRGAERAADFPLGVRLAIDDEFVSSFAVAGVPSSGPNEGNLVVFRGEGWNYVSINSRFNRRLLSPEDRFVSSGYWLHPLDDKWLYSLDGHTYLLDEIRFKKKKNHFELNRLFFGGTGHRASLLIHHFKKVR